MSKRIMFVVLLLFAQQRYGGRSLYRVLNSVNSSRDTLRELDDKLEFFITIPIQKAIFIVRNLMDKFEAEIHSYITEFTKTVAKKEHKDIQTMEEIAAIYKHNGQNIEECMKEKIENIKELAQIILNHTKTCVIEKAETARVYLENVHEQLEQSEIHAEKYENEIHQCSTEKGKEQIKCAVKLTTIVGEVILDISKNINSVTINSTYFVSRFPTLLSLCELDSSMEFTAKRSAITFKGALCALKKYPESLHVWERAYAVPGDLDSASRVLHNAFLTCLLTTFVFCNKLFW